jgi:hypothetical protein
MVINVVRSGQQFNATVWGQSLFDFQDAWNYANNSYSATISGDTVQVVGTMIAKYATQAQGTYKQLHNCDIQGGAMSSAATHNANQLRFLCNIDPVCSGFNTNGQLFFDTSILVNATGVSVWLKMR